MRRAKRERRTMEGRMPRQGWKRIPPPLPLPLLLLLCRGYELCNQAFSPDRETRIREEPTFAKYIYGMKYGEGGSRSKIPSFETRAAEGKRCALVPALLLLRSALVETQFPNFLSLSLVHYSNENKRKESKSWKFFFFLLFGGKYF